MTSTAVRTLPRDAIKSIDDPDFTQEYFGDPDDRVMVVEIENEPPTAYPTRILDYHHIVNDRIDGTPVVITWCPLCGSGVVFERLVDGRELTFGFSGKLLNDDMVMYDQETGSEWKQTTGRCLDGKLEGTNLSLVSFSLTSWESFTESYPGGRVLARPNQGKDARPFFEFVQHMVGKAELDTPSLSRHSSALLAFLDAAEDPEPFAYDRNLSAGYEQQDGFGFAVRSGGSREWDQSDIDPKEEVLGVIRGDTAVGIPRSDVTAAGGALEVSVADDDLVIFATANGMQAFKNRGMTFEPTDTQDIFVADSARWDAVTGESDDGRILERACAIRLFAFAWQDDHGSESFYQSDS